MSSYRSSYTPWKTSLSSAYKPTTSSAYSSRDDISSTRYSSLATPSTYRPSFSGGTYRIKRDPPSVPVTTYTSRYASVNNTISSGTARNEKENTNDGSSNIGQIKRYTTTTSNLGKYGSREPSPAALERTNRIKSREPSPVARSVRGKSRDPSPVIDTKCKIGYNGVNTYRMNTPRSTAPTYTTRYGASSNARSTSVLPDKSISYLSASDFRARSISRAKEIALRKSSEKEIEEAVAAQADEDTGEQVAVQEKDDSAESEELSEEETFVNVSVVTRATSPTPPGSTTVQRTRRIDIAKTIEKTIQRSTKKKKMLEKEIQSDRLDDSTRYSRFGISSRVSSYSPHSESRYSSNLRYSASPLSSASKSTSSSNENKKDDGNSSNSNKTNRSTSSKSKLSPPKVVRINSRQSSVENLSATNAKPPAAPKAESPTKSSTSSSSAVVKWPNKDFRKSALNVGPTDRPRKSRTPSTGTDSDAMPPNACEVKSSGNPHNNQRSERASSVGSECSNASATSNGKRTNNSGDGKARQRCHAKVSNNATTSSLSRNNSSTSLKNVSHKSCTPTTAAASSSSGTESSSENRKTHKKSTKKKATNTHNKTVENAKFRGDNNAGDANDLSPKHSTKFENSKASQPPATKSAATNQTDSSAQRAEESTSTATTTASDYRLQKLSTVSNFFVNCQNDANSEPIFVESSESSTDLNTDKLNGQSNVSLTEDFETKTNSQAYISPTSKATITNSDPARKAASSNTNSNSLRYTNTNAKSAEDSFVHNPPCSLRSRNSLSTHSSEARTGSSSYTQRTTATESELPTNTEQDESSWWQDTSRQIDTTSALDYNYKDEMHFKLRHIDSGETAWWLRNDEDDTLADDNIKTFNNEDDADEVTDAVQSLPSNSNSGPHNPTKQSWWTSETDDEHETNISRCRSAEAHYEPSSAAIESWDSRQYQLPKSRCTPEKQWWSESSNSKNTNSNSASKQNGSIQLKICRVESGERPWWLDEETDNNNVSNGNKGVIEDNATVEATIKLPTKNKNKSNSNSKSAEPSEGGSSNANQSEQEQRWWMSAPTKKLLNIKRVESGEKAWWQQEDTECNNNADVEVQHTQTKFYPIKRNDSCEKAWWLESNNDIASNGKQNGQLQIRESDDDSDGEVNQNGGDIEVQNINNYNGNDEIGRYIDSNAELSNSFNFEYSERPPPLGQCASPVGHEENTTNMRLCKSPYDNIPMSTVQSKSLQQQHQQQHQQQQQQQQSANTNPYCYFNNSNNNCHSNAQQAQQLHQQQQRELFISRHQSIDELLGGSCRPLSPLFFDGNSFSTLPTNRNMFLEKITPDQVIIHDSTAQMPIIQRMERDEWDNYNGSASGRPMQRAPQIPIDDAAIQVYKDGDYGAYLDLESSLAEQSEDIEGLNSSRKNSLVVRTQLSVRVHAIIEKLLSAEGSDLRRALFSLKQVFQEDKDLVHAFVALGGLNCLVRVGNGADQNYQNYILRALGQVMLYVDGMNGVMKHEPTMQWLYSLIASNYRSVVKTALKLLLVFVEYAESNCYVLVSAIHAVDKSQGTLPWSNIMRLLKDYDNADAELVIYATSLINKTLAGLNDQDSFYDETDLLEQQGMESVIQRYMSKPGTDIDLLDQLQLYEAVLKFEDGESDGIRLPDNSVRKTQRFRQGTDTAERRKSRRHSTGANPAVIQSPKKINTHGVLDEDSSGSTNSTEVSNGLALDKKSLDSAGVTPGLRRRRERAERHKSFLREQQEAATNGILAALEKRELESDEEQKVLNQLKRDHTVKDLTQKLSNLPTSPTQEKNRIVGDMSGLINKAKEGLAKTKSKGEMSRSSSVDHDIKKTENKKSENELHWEELVRNRTRPLNLCDLDFTDLNSDDEKDLLAPRGLGGGIPPPPPPISGVPPPMLPANMLHPPPSLTNSVNSSLNGSINGDIGATIKKSKKTVKLFWKEVREDMVSNLIGKTIWDELPAAQVDTQKLEHLFESRAKDLMSKEKQHEINKSKEIIVLDHKRSNAINIAITKLPPPRAIKAAILKMDVTVVTREGIDKLLNMLPTDEERCKIQEAQLANPELPLGSAEQFLLTLATISELGARLKLWAFRLDFDNSEKEIAEPLMDLKQGIEILRNNRTFKCILSTLLSVGIFLNGTPVKGFQIEYLLKVPEVKDTVQKHSLLHHLCHMVMESGNETTDLYSEIGPITRASKADFTELAYNLNQLEMECKASWDRLKLISKHDCPPQLQQKLVDFLADCAERIIILQIVHRRIINRYRKFLLWLGVPQHSVSESKPNEFCRIVSEFALEYRTTRERVQQQIEKKANHRERNKTRGKMIIDIAKFKTKEDRADAELKTLLGTPSADTADGTLTWRRKRADNLRSCMSQFTDENYTDGDDEILESLVKTATKAPGTRTTPRERKRTRHADRKSLRRTLKNGLTEEEKQHVAALIKTY